MLFTILDIETTGFRHNARMPEDNDNILEVGYIQVDENLKILRYGVFYFYKEDFVLNHDAEQIHGLTKEFLQEHIDDFDSSMIKLYTLMQEGIIIGKNNIGFDTPFILDFLNRRGQGLPAIKVVNQVDLQAIFTPIFRRWYKDKTGENTRRKGELGELMEVIGKSMESVEFEFKELFPDASDRCGAHSALFDTYMTYLLLKHAVVEGLDLMYYTTPPTEQEQYKFVETKCRTILQDICDSKAQHIEVVGCTDMDIGDQLGQAFSLFADIIGLQDYSANLGSDFDEMQDMLTLVKLGEFGKTLVTRKDGITHRFISSSEGELVFRIPYVVSSMLVMYYMNGDTLILLMAKCLLAFEGYLTNSDVDTPPSSLPFSCSPELSPYDMFCDYIDYRRDVLKIPTDINYESQELRQCLAERNIKKFWQVLIPSTGFVLREYFSGRIANLPHMLRHVIQLLRLRRGGR